MGYLSPVTHLSTYGVRRACEYLGNEGYRGVITGAIATAECGSYADAGFTSREHLHLLRHPLTDLPGRGATTIRRGRHRDRRHVLELDQAAFSDFWRLDEAGFDEARRATPVSRFRVATLSTEAVGYSITGRAATVSYLQRLAVEPDRHGQGLGFDLTVDALHWARSRRCLSMLVNTQETNLGALSLYEKLGFVRQTQGLYVFDRFFDRP